MSLGRFSSLIQKNDSKPKRQKSSTLTIYGNYEFDQGFTLQTTNLYFEANGARTPFFTRRISSRFIGVLSQDDLWRGSWQTDKIR